MKRILLLILLAASASQVFASIAVLPYRDQAFDPRISGKEYARMLSLGILIMKDTDVLSPEEADIGMKQLGINPEGSVDIEDLDAFGIKYNLKYILLGSISKQNGVFAFDNVLYSVRDRKILSRNNNSSGDIYKLIQLEVKDTLINFGTKKAVTGKTQADIVFLFDSSYNMSDEWSDVRDSISEFSSNLISRLNIDTRIYLAPYSERKSYESVTTHHNSIKGLNETLSRLQPGGAGNSDKFSSLLNYTLKNIKWRSGASKEIYIINNSKLDGMFVPERLAVEAKKRDIHINVISAGKVTGEFNEMERLASLTKGKTVSISYHQRVFDKEGTKHDIYLQRGRIFHSIAPHREWKTGILSSAGNNPKYVKPPQSLDEVFHTKSILTPDKLIQTFSEYTGINIIQTEPLQNNLADIVSSLHAGLSKSSGTASSGRVLLTDGKISFWIKVKNQNMLDTFEKYGKSGFYLKTGFNIKKSDADAYGIELIPVTTDISSDYIPDLAKTTLTDIVKNQEFFMTKGIGSPPVWFVEVKVENVERYDSKIDIRD
jgi:hypothetical protein